MDLSTGLVYGQLGLVFASSQHNMCCSAGYVFDLWIFKHRRMIRLQAICLPGVPQYIKWIRLCGSCLTFAVFGVRE